MQKQFLIAAICVLSVLGAQAKPGIKSIVVFGDSLCDPGNSAVWAERYADIVDPALVEDPTLIPTFPYPYYDNRASNGPVWIEIVAAAYGYKVDPAMEGGMNFAFAGAESGTGLSDQYTPNFHSQIRLYRMALERELIEPPMPWQLFVVWFGPNDVNRALAEAALAGEPVDPAVLVPRLAAAIAGNIAQGIVSLHEMGARMFLVPNIPPLNLTPYGASLEPMPATQRLLGAITTAANAALESALVRIENAYPKVTILRLDIDKIYTGLVAMPAAYGLVNVTDPVFEIKKDDQGVPQLVWLPVDPAEDPLRYDANLFLSFDGFHPTVAAHAVLAQEAMNVIPIGSWWGRSMARGPGGNAWTSMGWMNDTHWPWVYSYSLQDGAWMWAYEEGGTPEGFYAYVPKSYKWLFVNLMSGWYFDYSTGTWTYARMP